MKTSLSLLFLLFVVTTSCHSSDSAPTPSKIETLSIYYGYPSSKKEPWATTNVIAEDLQFPEHPEHDLTIKLVKEVGGLWCGYVPLGKEPEPTIMYQWEKYTKVLSLDQFKLGVLRWKSMGLGCIFIDTAGFDYENTRERQLAAHKIIHDESMTAVWNAWEPHDLPWAQFGTLDHFLFENFESALKDQRKLQEWSDAKPKGRGYAVVTRKLSSSEMAKSQQLVANYGLFAIQYRKDDHYETE